MNEVLAYLDEREEEFQRHLKIAQMLQDRVDGYKSEGQVEVRHVNTIKSGLVIHLYNIVEATMTRTLETIGRTVVTEQPRLWTQAVLEEWIRAEIWGGEERLGERAFRRLTKVSGILALGDSPTAFVVKSEPGSWNEKSVRRVARRLGCTLDLPSEVSRAAYDEVYKNNTTALTFLANRRNAIAHGESTFEDGANDITLGELVKLGQRILPYLRSVAACYRDFLQERQYLKSEEEAS